MNAQFNPMSVTDSATILAVRSNTIITTAQQLKNAAAQGLTSKRYLQLLADWSSRKAKWMTFEDLRASNDRKVQEAMVYLGMIDTNIHDPIKAHITGYDPKTGEFYTWNETLLYTIGKGAELSKKARIAVKAYNESGIKVVLDDLQIAQIEVALMKHYGKMRSFLLSAIRLFDRATEAVSMTKDGLAWSQWIAETFPACPKFVKGENYKDVIQPFLKNRIGMVKFERLMNTVDMWDAKLNLEVPKLVADGSTSDVVISAEVRESVLSRIDETYALGKDLFAKLFTGHQAIVFRTEADFLAWADGKVTSFLEDKYEREINEEIVGNAALADDEVAYLA